MRGICIFFVIFSLYLSPTFAQTIECGRDLFIGTIIPSINGGTVSLSSGNITIANGASIAQNGYNGEILITSPIDEEYSANINASFLYGDNQANEIKVLTIESEGQTSLNGNLSANSTKVLNTNASLEYYPAQKIGKYSGYYTISVEFKNSNKYIVEMCPINLTIQETDIILSEQTPLNFGSISKPISGGGIARINHDNSKSILNGDIEFLGSDSSRGEFYISASPNTTVTRDFNDGILKGTGQDMIVTNLTSNHGTTLTIPENGKTTIYIGADLIINNKQESGTYKGNYELFVNY